MSEAALKVAVAAAPAAQAAAELVRAAGRPVELVIADPWDVAELVRRGGADAGVVPKHVLDERSPDLFQVLDLGCGRETLVYAAARPEAADRDTPRVATRHVRLTRAHFAATRRQVRTIALEDPEVAVTLGSADGAVMPVPDGATQTEAGLRVLRPIMSSSLRVVVSGSSRVLRGALLNSWLEALLAVRGEANPCAAGRAEGAAPAGAPGTTEGAA